MTNEKLLQEVREAACSCEPMLGHTCYFCKYILPKLRTALKTEYRKTKSPYELRKLPKQGRGLDNNAIPGGHITYRNIFGMAGYVRSSAFKLYCPPAPHGLF